MHCLSDEMPDLAHNQGAYHLVLLISSILLAVERTFKNRRGVFQFWLIYDLLTGMQNRNAYEKGRDQWKERCSVSLSCIYSVGVAWQSVRELDMDSLIKLAEKRMYTEKQDYYRNLSCADAERI